MNPRHAPQNEYLNIMPLSRVCAHISILLIVVVLPLWGLPLSIPLYSVMYGIIVSVSVTFRITHTIHPKNNYLLARERGWLGTREPFLLICKQRQVFEFLGGPIFYFYFGNEHRGFAYFVYAKRGGGETAA